MDVPGRRAHRPAVAGGVGSRRAKAVLLQLEQVGLVELEHDHVGVETQPEGAGVHAFSREHHLGDLSGANRGQSAVVEVVGTDR
jgi:hypothetical protein